MADLISSRREGVPLTQSVNREYVGSDRIGLVDPPYPGLETIRNQTLPRTITEKRVSPHGGSDLSVRFSGISDIGGVPGEGRGHAKSGLTNSQPNG